MGTGCVRFLVLGLAMTTVSARADSAAELLARRQNRLPKGVAVEFREDSVGVSPEAFSIRERGGKVRITGSTLRGRIYGLGRLLRENAWRGEDAPKMSVRGVCLVPKAGNWYETASQDEIREFVEDLALWGCNSVLSGVALNEFAGADDPKFVARVERVRLLLTAAADCGLRISLFGISNDAFAGERPCPSQPDGLSRILESRRALLERFADLRLAQFCVVPYAPDGCGCAACAPWGLNGLWKILPAVARLVEEKLPGCRLELETSAFDRAGDLGEWKGTLARGEDLRKYVDCLSVGENFRKGRGSPGELPLMARIDLDGRRVSPQTCADLVKGGRDSLIGFRTWSEENGGEASRVLCLQLGWNPDRPWQTIVAEYEAAFGGSGREEVEKVLSQAHARLAGEFLDADGLILDYLGERPAPQDCAEGRPNALGWWTPIENGPMFTGPYLRAMCERAVQTGREEDRALCRKMAAGLVKAASVSDVPGMVVRGFATDGHSHYPLGSEDQTLAWFFGLHAYAQSGLPTEGERTALVEKMSEEADALERDGWKCPCDGRFKGEFRGEFTKGLPFRGAAHYLYLLKAMFDVTGDEVWQMRYERAAGERPSDCALTRLEICERGYATDLDLFSVEQGGMWIYVCAQGCLAELARLEDVPARRAIFRRGLAANAERAVKRLGLCERYDNGRSERPFHYANWRTGYRWREQTTQAEAERVASTGDEKVLGSRKWYERQNLTTPLACAAVVGYAGDPRHAEAIGRVIRHYDYATANIGEFFLSEVAWNAQIWYNVRR